MRRNIKAIIALVTVALLCAGCIKENGEPPATKENLPASVISEFENNVPEATIFDYLICDIGGEESQDYIILFSKESDTAPVALGLSVCLDNSVWSRTDLASDTEFRFCSAPSVRFEDDMPIIAVQAQDTKNNIKYSYEVEFSWDSKNNETKFSIKTDILED